MSVLASMLDRRVSASIASPQAAQLRDALRRLQQLCWRTMPSRKRSTWRTSASASEGASASRHARISASGNPSAFNDTMCCSRGQFVARRTADSPHRCDARARAALRFVVMQRAHRDAGAARDLADGEERHRVVSVCGARMLRPHADVRVKRISRLSAAAGIAGRHDTTRRGARYPSCCFTNPNRNRDPRHRTYR